MPLQLAVPGTESTERTDVASLEAAIQSLRGSRYLPYFV